jgi:hypothetical protein
MSGKCSSGAVERRLKRQFQLSIRKLRDDLQPSALMLDQLADHRQTRVGFGLHFGDVGLAGFEDVGELKLRQTKLLPQRLQQGDAVLESDNAFGDLTLFFERQLRTPFGLFNVGHVDAFRLETLSASID